jgi:hypothetical protein
MLLDRKSKQLKEFQKANSRRVELLRRKIAGSLSTEEEQELQECESICNRLLPPVSPEQWQQLKKLERHVHEMVLRNRRQKID